MNLVWLDINSSYSHSSLALPAIEACRRGDSYQWKSVSGTINSDIFLITKELYESKPDFIAATLWLFNHEVVMKICERIKALLPEVKIVLGGPEFNGCNENFLRRNSCINSVFRGEGEEQFHAFLDNTDYSEIVGLCYIDNNGNYKDNGAAKVADFASLPIPEQSSFFNYSSPFVQIETSRGCFNSCAFCVSGGDKPIRSKGIETIRKRIENVRDRGIKDVRILDRTFNYSISRAKAMIALFLEFPQMNFHLEIHPALLSDELCEVLASTPKNLLHLEAGMQSLDDKVIEACGRFGTNEKALSGLTKLCKMDNFETHADLIAGLPHYTFKQILKDIRTLSSIAAGEIQLELLKLLPGTKMRNEADSLGIRYAISPPYEVLQTPAMSINDLDRARLLSKMVDKFYNAKGWQKVTQKLINENDDFLTVFLEYLIERDMLEKPLSLEKRGTLLYQFCKEKYPSYCDYVSLEWIKNGLSLRRVEAGNIDKAHTLPEGMEREFNVHYYIWQGENGEKYIVAFDRSKEHSKPYVFEKLEVRG
ncbi:MAG: DUF4080 domain-containing protein [Rikenellaceae bacterium]